MWFGEDCSCCCLSLLPQLAYNILATTYKDYFPAQYTRTDMYEKAVMHAYWEVAAERGKEGRRRLPSSQGRKESNEERVTCFAERKAAAAAAAGCRNGK